jgi:hypothetical protein
LDCKQRQSRTDIGEVNSWGDKCLEKDLTKNNIEKINFNVKTMVSVQCKSYEAVFNQKSLSTIMRESDLLRIAVHRYSEDQTENIFNIEHLECESNEISERVTTGGYVLQNCLPKVILKRWMFMIDCKMMSEINFLIKIQVVLIGILSIIWQSTLNLTHFVPSLKVEIRSSFKILDSRYFSHQIEPGLKDEVNPLIGLNCRNENQELI